MKNIIFLFTSALCCFTSTTSFGQEQEINMFPKETFKYSIESKAVEEQPVVYRDITTTIAGSLSEKIGNEANTIDSLVVVGPINADDIRTLWDASFKGRLSVINLENAEIENGIVPEDAFWHQKEQLDPSGEFINTIHLRRIILPDGVKRIEEGAFMYCINLEEINIPSSLQYLGTYAFSDCVSLKTDPLIFPEGFERFGQLVFSDCSSLTGKVVLPSTIKEIDDGAFFRSKITSINLPEGLERIGLAAFYACRLEEIWIPNSCQDLSSPTLFQQNYFLKRIHLPKGLDRIPNGFADACFKLQEINIPSSVKSIGIEAFQQCYSLKKIELPNGLETIEKDAFWHCSGLKSITIPSSVTYLGTYCFSYCSGLTSITIPSSVTYLGYGCFWQCKGLTSITIPSSVTSLGESCFLGCSGLTSITIPSSVTSLGESCFNACSGLKSINIPSSITSLGESCFNACSGLKSINIPSSVTSLGESCFEECSGLTSINIPSSVTSLGKSCFEECSGLTSITIPSSVTSLGDGCFKTCSKLEKATFQGELPRNTINCGLQSTCIFYVPKAYLQDYKDELGSKYSYIYASKDEESGEQKPEQCAVPTISYADGKLTFASSTPNAEYHYTITDSDIASDAYCQNGIVKLYAAYNISVYATADGYKASDKATATLYWIEANLQNNTTNINQTATRGIIATSNDGIVTLSGLNNSEIVRFYTVDGKQIGTAKAINGTASQAVSESIVIVKIGNQTIKIAVK